MRFAAIGLLTLCVGCTSTRSDDSGDEDVIVADTDPGGGPVPLRVLFGRVHDTEDQNRGLPGVTVRVGDVEAVTDATGQYRIEAPDDALVLSVDASDQGWTPHFVHLPQGRESLEVWAGLLPIDLTNEALSVMAATADIAPTLQDDVAYVVAQVRMIGDVDTYPEGGEVSVTIDGEPAPDTYQFAYNEVLDTCLPSRVDDGPVVTDVDCDGIVLVPGVPPGAEVGIDMTHPLRKCARSTEARLDGEAASRVTYTITPLAGGLNVTGVECGKP